MSKEHIMVVEDEPKIARLLADYLQREGYEVTVMEEGTHVVEKVRECSPDFLVLDLMLPGVDGLTICREVRQFSNVPVMMLTARVEEIDRLLGLELGADDYVCKPFSPREVVARVRTILRRVQVTPQERAEEGLTYRDITLYPDRHECVVQGKVIDLTPVEFKMLTGLISRPGRVYSRDQLMDLSYSDERIVSNRTIDTHVKNLRKKLAPYITGGELIHSIYGVGYKAD